MPDLASRLRAIAAGRIGPPERALLAALLSRLLSDRQLAMPDRVRDWLLLNLPGTPAALRDAVARLDRAALASARRISLPMARETLCIRDFDDIMASSPAATFRDDSLL